MSALAHRAASRHLPLNECRPVPTLCVKLAPNFAPAVRGRGDGYLSRVKFSSFGGTEVRAQVVGTRHYEVIARLEDSTLWVLCTCPYFAETDLCKHLWATLRAADNLGYLSAARATASLAMLPMTLDDEALDDDPLGDDRPDDEWNGPPGDDGARTAPRRRDDISRAIVRSTPTRAAPGSSWDRVAGLLTTDHGLSGTAEAAQWRDGSTVLLYVVDQASTQAGSGIAVALMQRRKKKDGQWSKLQRATLRLLDLPGLGDEDRRIVSLLVEPRSASEAYYGPSGISFASYDRGQGWTPTQFALGSGIAAELLPVMCRTGRCAVQVDGAGFGAANVAEPALGDLAALAWDDGPPWRACVCVRPEPGGYRVTGELRRAGERLALSAPLVLTAGGLLITRTTIARLEADNFAWIQALRAHPELRVPRQARVQLLTALHGPNVPAELDLPEELRLEELRVTPCPRLRVRKPERPYGYVADMLLADLAFDYDGIEAAPRPETARLLDAARGRIIVRDLELELRARLLLLDLGFDAEFRFGGADGCYRMRTPRKLPQAAAALLDAGWQVEAEGSLMRRGRSVALSVHSGIDWFELEGAVDFDGVPLPFPRLLAAIRRGERTVRLGDGTTGVLPQAWLEQYASLAPLAQAQSTGEHVRFGSSQAFVLDALLAALPEVQIDEAFARARDRIAAFRGVAPRDPPRSFVGQLRPYQRDGLGWLLFLRELGFGGCLADDMGLGKTVQVLALLDTLRRRRPGRDARGGSERALPSLVVVPRSLLFNWSAEAARFTPKLRLFVHDGPGRAKAPDAFADADVVLMTYGMMRRDVTWLAGARFDTVILDETQAIKNPATAVAKAARLLRGEHRLAMSGTPIENHLGELWSLFEFLDPGMLGTAGFAKALQADARDPSSETRAWLARALAPLLLRRTKEQVARDLPPKVEQTVYCDLEHEQRALYEELRKHYQASLRARIEADGLARSKMHVLEALLRLRQAACHPALVDRARTNAGSAKLDVLLPMLAEIAERGHKALVFSQFTSLLALVRERLDPTGVSYQYLDGHTRDRAARVTRFNDDPGCPLFLVSLKAGGLGLNLTAADYVFLLDPWWNPAVEAQAVDRSHRIGQQRKVFAYRLVARGTIEEKMLELQARKRGLADDIIKADSGLLRRLDREDLEALLG